MQEFLSILRANSIITGLVGEAGPVVFMLSLEEGAGIHAL